MSLNSWIFFFSLTGWELLEWDFFSAPFSIWSQMRIQGGAWISPSFEMLASQDPCIHLRSVQTTELLHKPKYYHELEPHNIQILSDFHWNSVAFKATTGSNSRKYVCFQRHTMGRKHNIWIEATFSAVINPCCCNSSDVYLYPQKNASLSQTN